MPLILQYQNTYCISIVLLGGNFGYRFASELYGQKSGNIVKFEEFLEFSKNFLFLSLVSFFFSARIYLMDCRISVGSYFWFTLLPIGGSYIRSFFSVVLVSVSLVAMSIFAMHSLLFAQNSAAEGGQDCVSAHLVATGQLGDGTVYEMVNGRCVDNALSSYGCGMDSEDKHYFGSVRLDDGTVWMFGNSYTDCQMTSC